MIIDVRRHPVVIMIIILFIAWMFVWAYSLVLLAGGITDLLRHGDGSGAGLIIVFYIVWICAGIGMIIMIIWALKRKETITFTSGMLRIERKALGIGWSDEYSIYYIKNLRLNRIPEPEEGLSKFFWYRRYDMWGTRPGNLAFDYGMRTVNFARGIDEPEAKYLMELFHKRGVAVYTSDKN